MLGVSGAISAYKALELTRLLVREGASVLPVMTRGGAEFISPLSLATLARQKVFTDIFTAGGSDYITHIELAQNSDLIIVAPATANIIGKTASGIADDPLTTVLAAATVPILIAPSMNTGMWENAIVRGNVEKLKGLGYLFVGPAEGELACGTVGRGRLAEPADIVEAAREALSKKDLLGEKVLVTAGPTRERIDPIRFVSNASSGRMGYALARVARRRGAEVVLISGPSYLERPGGVSFVRVTTAAEMFDASVRYFPQSTLVVMAAAIADYRPVKSFPEKIKKEDRALTVDMERTGDVLKYMGKHKRDGQFLIGFALETENLEENARRKLKEKDLDIVVGNSPGGLDSETNEVTIINRDEEVEFLPPACKEAVAEKILDLAVRMKGRE